MRTWLLLAKDAVELEHKINKFYDPLYDVTDFQVLFDSSGKEGTNYPWKAFLKLKRWRSNDKTC